MQKMTLEQMRLTFNSGGLAAAQIIAQGRKFCITADTRTGGRVILVMHTGREPRLYGKPATALRTLHEIGFKSVSVELANWTPEQSDLNNERQLK